MMRTRGIVRSSATFPRVSSTGWPRRPWPQMREAKPRAFEAFRFARILGALREASGRCLESGAREVRLSQSKSTPSVARLQKDWRIWSVRVGRSYRALGGDAEDGIVWSWI